MEAILAIMYDVFSGKHNTTYQTSEVTELWLKVRFSLLHGEGGGEQCVVGEAAAGSRV